MVLGSKETLGHKAMLIVIYIISNIFFIPMFVEVIYPKELKEWRDAKDGTK